MTQSSSKRPPENPPNISGLEKIILLIAFIVIAAMFTYTVLTTELFADDQDQETKTAVETSPTVNNIRIGGE